MLSDKEQDIPLYIFTARPKFSLSYSGEEKLENDTISAQIMPCCRNTCTRNYYTIPVLSFLSFIPAAIASIQDNCQLKLPMTVSNAAGNDGRQSALKIMNEMQKDMHG